MIGAGAIFVIAVGAILRYAVNRDQISGVSIDTIGLILMIAGAVALVLALFQYFFWNERAGRREVLVDDRRQAPPVEERRDLPPRY
jgi:hypothetical protein